MASRKKSPGPSKPKGRPLDSGSVKSASGEEHLWRVRRICARFPGCEEKLSHGEPSFFVNKKLFAMFANNHHNDGHIAVWAAAPQGTQEMLIHTSPEIYFRPPYVGVRGWVGVELRNASDDELTWRLLEAWRMIAPKNSQRTE